MHDSGSLIFLAAMVFSSISAGVVWFLQLNHYPLYRAVPEHALTDYITAHNRRLLLPVIIPMAIAIGTTGLLLLDRPADMGSVSVFALSLSLLAILISTAALQGPAHLRLERNPNQQLISSIIATNWIRTLCWSLNVIVLGAHAAGVDQ